MKQTRGDRIAEALTFVRQGRLAEARALRDTLLGGDLPEALTSLDHGIAAADARAGAARAAIAADPADAAARCELGLALKALGKHDLAMASLTAATVLRPKDAAGHRHRGVLASELNRHETALNSLRIALELNPDTPDAHHARGISLWALNRRQEAIEAFDVDVRLRPDFALSWLYRGLLLHQVGRPDEALASFERARQCDPNDPAPDYEIARVHGDRNECEAALIHSDRAVALRPDYALAHWNRGIFLMLLGRREEGWREFEWRRFRDFFFAGRDYPRPLWTGQEDLSGKTLFLYTEQGAGDAIQFARFLPRVRDRGARVFLAARTAQVGLFRRVDEAITVIGPDDAPPPFDFHAPLMSLPHLLGPAGGNVRTPVPYLRVDPHRRATWAAHFAAAAKPKIGVAWFGNPDHPGDAGRSIPLGRIVACLPADHAWCSLQNTLRPEDRAAIEAGAPVMNFADSIRDFDDLAAMIEAMDLVISVDTAVAHLAGALGKLVFVLLPFHPDWRWELGRDDTPWYPTMRLFRQPRPGAWDDVFPRVLAAARGMMSRPRRVE